MSSTSTMPSAGTPPRTSESIKDTLESVIVAFILAFVFRAFIVEAFVIPTGSMAPTLYGVHGMQTCQDCGTGYAFGLKEQPGPENPSRTCPNCRNVDDQPPVTPNDYQSGDRILVLKWPFDLGQDWFGPRRWDVVVFKDPADGLTNFIKRLIGMPNEVLEIIDGDIYAVPVSVIEAKDPGLMDRLEERRQLIAEYGRLTQLGRSAERRMVRDRLQSLGSEITGRLDPLLTIRRKADTKAGRRAQESLWLSVHHQDYLPHRPRDLSPAPRWRPADADSRWNAGTPVITFAGQDASEQALVFDVDGDVGPIRDYYAYNETAAGHGDLYAVGDLRLRFWLTVGAGDGFLRLRFWRQPDQFTATLHANGRITVERFDHEHNRRAVEPEIDLDPLVPGRPVRVEFANVDYRLSLQIDGEEVFAKEYDASLALEQLRLRGGSAPAQRSRAAMSAEGIDLALRHVSLDRDVYYQPTVLRSNGARNAKPILWPDLPGWGTTRSPIWLREDEFFMLGDNSPQSADSRLWGNVGDHLAARGDDYQVGTVPRDQLIGRAFFVYWPSGLRVVPTTGRMTLPWNVRLVPNAGDMRWIR